MLLVEQDTIRKEWVNKTLPEPTKEFEAVDNKEYKAEAIIDSAIYSKETNNQMLDLYYLILWKSYPEEENTQKHSAAVKYLRKLISIFYKEHLKQSIATFLSLDSTLPIAKPIVLKE